MMTKLAKVRSLSEIWDQCRRKEGGTQGICTSMVAEGQKNKNNAIFSRTRV